MDVATVAKSKRTKKKWYRRWNNNEEFAIIIPSNRHWLAKYTKKSLFPLESHIFDGTGYPSYSKIMNDVIEVCPTELLIVCNDKGRPKPKHVEKVIKLIKKGFGMVWLHPFGFGGFYKDVIRQIGFYDERFTDGNYEDCDMYRRLKESNIAIYEQFEIKWLKKRSSWVSEKSKEHMKVKWRETDTTLTRLMLEEECKYDIGRRRNIKFLPWNKSIVVGTSMNFKNRVKIRK